MFVEVQVDVQTLYTWVHVVVVDDGKMTDDDDDDVQN